MPKINKKYNILLIFIVIFTLSLLINNFSVGCNINKKVVVSCCCHNENTASSQHTCKCFKNKNYYLLPKEVANLPITFNLDLTGKYTGSFSNLMLTYNKSLVNNLHSSHLENFILKKLKTVIILS